MIFKVAEQLIPSVRQAGLRGVMAAVRPLLITKGAGGRTATRGFTCFNHSAEGAPGFFSAVGGKTTTARLMAEKVADQVCAFLGIEAPCLTREFPLLSYRNWAQA